MKYDYKKIPIIRVFFEDLDEKIKYPSKIEAIFITEKLKLKNVFKKIGDINFEEIKSKFVNCLEVDKVKEFF